MSIEIDILRGSDVIATVKPNNTSNQQKRIMGDSVVSLSFGLSSMVNFNIGDHAVIFNETYTINKMPVVTKRSRYNYDYDLQLQASQYELRRAQYLFYGSDNTLKEGEFSLIGTAATFIDLLVLNANRVSAGWVKGGVIDTEYKTLTFSKEDCLSVLAKLATEFGTEYYVEGTKIHLAKLQTPTPYSFKYGRNKGLYQISRSQNESAGIITRLYAFGGTKNIPSDYQNYSTRLRLPGLPASECLVSKVSYTVEDNGDGTNNITFNWVTPTGSGITTVVIESRVAGSDDDWAEPSAGSHIGPRTFDVPSGAREYRFKTFGGTCDQQVTEPITISQTSGTAVLRTTPIQYLEKNTDIYGIIESTLILEDVYPRRTGIVTSVDATDVYKFGDSDIDFDINNQLLPGLPAKITFNTGQLAGYTFEIKSFDYSIKQFIILKNKDEKTLDLPSSAIKISIGDEYVLTDINMPQSYIDAAETELQTKAQEYLDKYSVPQYQYTIICDPAYFRKNRIRMNIGDIVWISDIELQLAKNIRVVGLTKSLIDEYEYTLELGDTVSAGTLTQIIATQSSTQSDVQNLGNALDRNRLLSGTNIGDLKIEQGTVIIKDIETASDTSGMKLLYIDVNGKLWKEA